MPFVLIPGHRMVGETRSGYWVEVGSREEAYRAFVPKPLPPAPAVTLGEVDAELSGRADRALGRLDGTAEVFPDIEVFLSVWLLREAVYSSQIEGTQSSLSDLLLFEADRTAEAVDDLTETANYVDAVNAGIASLDQLPVSMRLLREAHARLLSSGRGSEKQPGEIRTTQNWIGGTRPGNARYVPVPPQYLPDVLTDLENFLNDVPSRTPLLVKIAMAHAQFETIHPFLDGNGRVGRLLIVLLLQAEGALRRPLLYVSLFLKRHRAEYYELLQRIRTEGDWESWIRFFLEAVAATADDAVATARSAMRLFVEDERRIRERAGKAIASLQQIFIVLQRSPIATAKMLEARTGLANPTVLSAINTLVELGILRELTGKRRNRTFGYDAYLAILRARDDDDA